jgi:hypothetical protein
MSMSKWWILRVTWLVLGLLTGLITFLPESAETLTGTIALLFILATLVLLGRWAVVIVSEKLKSALAKPDRDKTTLARHEFFPGAALEFEATKVGAEKPPASVSKTELSRFKFAGFSFKTILNTEEIGAQGPLGNQRALRRWPIAPLRSISPRAQFGGL